MAIRDAEIAAEVNGINLTRYKLRAFALSSFYTGVHGALYAQVLGHIEPQIFNALESITLFVAVIIGGVASVEGSILGAAFVLLVPKLFSNFREMVPVVYGVTILLVLIFEPLGLYGRWLKTRLYFQLWRSDEPRRRLRWNGSSSTRSPGSPRAASTRWWPSASCSSSTARPAC